MKNCSIHELLARLTCDIMGGSAAAPSLKESIRILDDDAEEVFVSYVSFWEINIKFSLGKVSLGRGTPEEIFQWCKEAGFKILPLSEHVVVSFYKLPRALHKDPFDRMLVWQCINRRLTLVSNDELLDAYLPYGLSRFW